MAVQNLYYLDAPSFSAATKVYTDAALTTVAPDGYYSDQSISREQVSGVLLPQITCPSCDNSFLVGFGSSSVDACDFVTSATVTGNDTTFCNSTTFTGSIFQTSPSGAYYISYQNYYLQVSVTNGNPVATVVGSCVLCAPSYAISGCGVSGSSAAGACSDAGANPKILYSDCPSGTIDVGCSLFWDANMQFPVTEPYVFAESNWNMDGSGGILSYSAIQC